MSPVALEMWSGEGLAVSRAKAECVGVGPAPGKISHESRSTDQRFTGLPTLPRSTNCPFSLLIE